MTNEEISKRIEAGQRMPFDIPEHIKDEVIARCKATGVNEHLTWVDHEYSAILEAFARVLMEREDA